MTESTFAGDEREIHVMLESAQRHPETVLAITFKGERLHRDKPPFAGRTLYVTKVRWPDGDARAHILALPLHYPPWLLEGDVLALLSEGGLSISHIRSVVKILDLDYLSNEMNGCYDRAHGVRRTLRRRR